MDPQSNSVRNRIAAPQTLQGFDKAMKADYEPYGVHLSKATTWFSILIALSYPSLCTLQYISNYLLMIRCCATVWRATGLRQTGSSCAAGFS